MKRTKAIVLALSAAAALGAGVFSMTSQAAFPYMVETYYFSDAAHTNEVGFRIRNCNGSTYTTGTVTLYKEVYREPCGFQKPQ